MFVDALQLKEYFVRAGLEADKAEMMAKGVRDVIKESDLATKQDLMVLKESLTKTLLTSLSIAVAFIAIVLPLVWSLLS